MALDFPQSFKYPFNRAKGLLNVFWILVPIYGWFLLVGYRVRIVTEFTQGRFRKLPQTSPNKDFILGFKMFFKAIPGVLVLMAASMVLGLIGEGNSTLSGLLMFVYIVLVIIIVPILAINFIKKRTIAAYFEFDLVKKVIRNPMDYFLTLLKEFALGLLFLVMSLILVGIPAGMFTKNIFLADFYRRHTKR